MTAFTVPRYLAETARRDQGVRKWITALPSTVADLAGRWSLRVGEPFQPGGQCSWTAPVTGPAGTRLVLKVGYRFPGGDERDGLAADPVGLAARMAALAGVEAARVRHWLFARSVQESVGSPLMRQVARALAPA
jgi:hypothetical protein